MAKTFFVLVIGTTALGSVDKLRRVAIAACCSSTPLLVTQLIRSVNNVLVAKMALLLASEDIFWRVRSAQTRSRTSFDDPAPSRASNIPGNRAIVALFAGRRERLHKISRHLPCSEESESLATSMIQAKTVLLEQKYSFKEGEEAMFANVLS